MESARDVQWVRERAPTDTPLICAIETARGLLAAQDIASMPGVLDTFARAGDEATKLPDGEFIDLPVAQRAQRVLEFSRALDTGLQA